MVFVSQFILALKAAETPREWNEAFSKSTAIGGTAQWQFKKFCRGDDSLQDDERSFRHSNVDNDPLRDLYNDNPRLTVSELAVKLDVISITPAIKKNMEVKRAREANPSQTVWKYKKSPLRCIQHFFCATRKTHLLITS